MKKKVLVIGSLNMDIVTRMEKMPVLGETVLGKKLDYIPGGKGANQAFAAGSLNGKVKMLGCVGNDEFGEVQKEALRSKKVDIRYLKQSDRADTGMAIVYVNTEGNNSIVVIPGANSECNITYLKENDAAFQESDFVLLQMEIPQEVIWYSIERAYELGKTVILNPAPAPDTIPDEILKKIDYLTPNETEVLKLTQGTSFEMDSIIKASRMLIEKGVANVITTLGERGCLLVNQTEEELFPARKAKPVDTTAAGDCFNGAFVVALAEGKTEQEAIRFANAASSLAVMKEGAQNSIPTREETDNLLHNG